MPRTPTPRTPKLPSTPNRLGQGDWLDAAFAAVVEGGFDQARVLSLSKQLGVTRGSFYWHFASHADLIEALWARWYARELAVAQQLRSHTTDRPKADLMQLVQVALAHAGEDLQNMRFELALRDLGRHDAKVAQHLAQVDQMRLSLFEEKFLRLTANPKTAADLAGLFYLALVGCYQALSRPNNPPGSDQHLMRLISVYLVEPHQASSNAKLD